MSNKPMPTLRKPSPTSAASFVEGSAAPRLQVAASPEEMASVEQPLNVPSELSSAVADLQNASPTKPKRAAERRRMTIYLSKATAKKLALRSVNEDRDMSDIVEDVLAAAFERAKQ